MLLGQNGGRPKNRHLLSVQHGLEGRPNRHLRFAETDVAANEAIHGMGLLHIRLGGLDGFHLIGRLPKGESGFEFALPGIIGGKARSPPPNPARLGFFNSRAARSQGGFLRLAPGLVPTIRTYFSQVGA